MGQQTENFLNNSSLIYTIPLKCDKVHRLFRSLIRFLGSRTVAGNRRTDRIEESEPRSLKTEKQDFAVKWESAIDASRLRKRMTTNHDAFEQFLILCEPDVSSSAERHRRLRAKLIRFFASRRCEDAEGLADETIGRLVSILYAGEHIENPPAYALGIARNVYREHVRKTARLSQIDEDCETAIEEQQGAAELDSFDDECARLCFQKLPNDKRQLLEQYYSGDGSREELAEQTGVSLAGLRTKIHRLKAELKKCYRECMQGQLGLRRN